MALEYIPLIGGLAFLTVAAIAQLTIKRVPNILNFSSLILALMTSIFCGQGTVPSFGGNLAAALTGCIVGLFALLPFYVITDLGAGCVKSNAAFGAWIGCAFSRILAVKIIVLGSIAGSVLTIISSILWFKYYVSPEQLDEEEPQPSLLFPAQVSLSAGSIAVLLTYIPSI